MPQTIDLNLDAGEFAADLASGKEEALYQQVSSVNIACGGHAGTPETMRAAVALATKHGLAIGAHPSFPDRENFGRQVVAMPYEELVASLVAQTSALKEICREEGARLHHLKPHGALYNAAASDPELTRALIETVHSVDPKLILVGLAGSPMLETGRRSGIETAAEGFVDRRYEDDGSLRARKFPDALITDPEVAASQAAELALGRGVVSIAGKRIELSVRTLCIHGDTADSLTIAKAVRSSLEKRGIHVRAMSI